MTRIDQNFAALATNGLQRPTRHRLGSTVIVFSPIGAAANRPVQHLRKLDHSNSPHADAAVIPFRRMPRWLAPGKYPKTGVSDSRDSTTSDDDDRRRTLENWLAAAWVALMIAGFNVLNALSTAASAL